VFPWKDEYAQPSRLIRAGRSYDCGVKFYAIASDIDGDGLDEVLVYDRDRVWLFHSPEWGPGESARGVEIGRAPGGPAGERG